MSRHPASEQDAEQRLELLERQLGKQYDPASRPKAERPQVKAQLEPWSKRLEGKERACVRVCVQGGARGSQP